MSSPAGSGGGSRGVGTLKRVLFICSRNRLRSPTAEQIFSEYPGIETASAGLDNDADMPIDAELIAWADIIFVMEKNHRDKLRRRFRALLKSQRLICLDIPDIYGFMAPELIHLLEAKVRRYLS
jgi:predicted protein tyrosine phosphatase